jgi:hypothetical protein
VKKLVDWWASWYVSVRRPSLVTGPEPSGKYETLRPPPDRWNWLGVLVAYRAAGAGAADPVEGIAVY